MASQSVGLARQGTKISTFSFDAIEGWQGTISF
jgi:hypothetical protein